MVSKVNKLDFFVGAFLSSIINSSVGVPALFDETENSKRVEFETNKGHYNVYIKYTTSGRRSTRVVDGQKKKNIRYNIGFSENEYLSLMNKFYKKDVENLICLVCANKKLNDNALIILDYRDAMRCLEKSTPGGSRRITATRLGAEYDYSCYGVGFKEKDYIKAPVNWKRALEID